MYKNSLKLDRTVFEKKFFKDLAIKDIMFKSSDPIQGGQVWQNGYDLNKGPLDMIFRKYLN